VSVYRPTLPEGWSWRDGFGRGYAASGGAWCRIVEKADPSCPGTTRVLVRTAFDVPDDVVEACIEDFYEPVTCCRGDDWTRIGAWDGSRNRSIWVRLTFMGPTRLCLSEAGEPVGEVRGPCVSIELCAGREGSDDYVKILPTDVSDASSRNNPPIYSLLVGLFKSQLWALEVS
jgi:hypothetical protein